MNRRLWLLGFQILLISSIGLSAPKRPDDSSIPSEDDLLNFDNVDKGNNPAPPQDTTDTSQPPPAPTAHKRLGEIPSMAPPPGSEAGQDTQNPMLTPAPPSSPPPPDPLEESLKNSQQQDTGTEAPAPAPAPVAKKEAPPPVPPPPAQEPEALPPAPPQQAEAPPPMEENIGGVSKSDERNETRFARIYKKYNQAEISDDDWAKIAGDRSSESYTLQQGDTLWDVSTKFFGNGFYWPKVWQLNDQITNPHNIRAGNGLKFQPGSTTAAPQLAVNENGASTEEETNEEGEDTITVEDESGDQNGAQIAIPPSSSRHPRVAEIPPSFKPLFSSDMKVDKNGFTIEGVPHKIPSATSYIPSIIVDPTWEKSGKIVELEGGATVASTYQNVIVQSDTELHKGDFLTVFSSNGGVEDPVDGGTIGTEVQTRGVVQIIEQIEGAEGNYRGMITLALWPVRIGDVVRAGKNVYSAVFDASGPLSQVSARIVNGEFGQRRVLGLYNVVYLDKGQDDGLQVGNVLNVLKNVKTRDPKSIVHFDSKPIGMIKIVNLDKTVSTGVIVTEFDAIQPGDETGLVVAADATSTEIKAQGPEGGDGGDSTPTQDEKNAAP